MNKFIIYNKVSKEFIILNTIVEVDKVFGTGIGRAVKYAKGVLEKDDYVMVYMKVPKDRRGGYRSSSSF